MMILDKVSVKINDTYVTGRIMGTRYDAKTKTFVTIVQEANGTKHEISQQF